MGEWLFLVFVLLALTTLLHQVLHIVLGVIEQSLDCCHPMRLVHLYDSLVDDSDCKVQTLVPQAKGVVVSVSARGGDGVAYVGVDGHSQFIQASSTLLFSPSSTSNGGGCDLVTVCG